MIVLILAIASLDACVEARAARIAHSATTAVERAKVCVDRFPDEPDAYIELSRSLAFAGDFEAGEQMARRGARLAPDYPEARARYAEALLWSASARERASDVEGAWRRLSASCAIDGCPTAGSWWRRLAPFRPQLLQRTLMLGSAEQTLADTEIQLPVRFGGVVVAPMATMRLREFLAGSTEVEARGGGGLGYVGGRVSAEAVALFGPAATSLPKTDVRARLGYAIGDGVEVGVFGRYLRFSGQDVLVGGPSACLYLQGDDVLCGELSAASGGELTVFGLVRGFWSVSQSIRLQAGVGAGNGVDFTNLLPGQGQSSLLGLVGIQGFATHELGFELLYAIRREATDARPDRWIHELTVGWTGAFQRPFAGASLGGGEGP